MENKEQIRQSLEDIYNQIQPTLEKLEVKRLESVKIKKRCNIQLQLGISLILIIALVIMFYFKNIISIYFTILSLPLTILIFTVLCFSLNRVNFNIKDLKYRLMYKLISLLNLYKWNDTGFGDEIEGIYKDIKFSIIETSDNLNINFNTKRFYKVKTTIYTKGSRPKYIFSSDKLPDLFFLGFYSLLIVGPILILFFYNLYQIDWKNVEINWETIKSIPMVIGHIIKQLGFSGFINIKSYHLLFCISSFLQS